MNSYKLMGFYVMIITTLISSSVSQRPADSGHMHSKASNINNLEGNLNVINGDEDIPDDEDEPVRIRTEDYCSFTKLEKRVQPKPDPEECNKINELFKVNNDYNFINYFGQAFDLLNKGTDSLVFPSRFKMDTIFFTGNTGSGKSTLVQILGTDNGKIFSKPVNEEKTEYIIVDSNSKIGAETINSETLYPDLVVDRETNYVLCDNPGFRDTRSPVHEIVAMYSMKKVLQHTDKIKVVIVTTHSSVKTGMYRDDFTNLLKHTIDLFSDIDKYKYSFYLIASKVENTYSLENRKIKVVSDKEVVNEIGQFLIDVKSSLRGRKNVFNSSSNNLYYVQTAVKVINSLLEKDSDTYSRINILRRPAEEGPISDIDIIQAERTNIRNALLNNNNMVKVSDEDFGFALSDSAIMYLTDLFQKMNSYITELTDLISLYITGYYKTLINSQTDITEIIEILNKLKSNIKSLSRNIQYAENPSQYINIMSNFSVKNNLKLDCLTVFKNISTLNEYLSNLNDFSSSAKYSSLSWSNSIGKISTYINDGLQKYQFVQNLYQYINSYEIQKMRKSYNKVLEKVNELFGVNLNSDDNSYATDSDLSGKIDEILRTNLKHRIDFLCKDNTLIITDYIVLISELKDDYFSACDAKKIVILAMHTIYIDEDFVHDWLRGKDLTIISPKWDVKGSRKINVNGISGGAALPKADLGQIGMFGNNGKQGGKFYGIGMNFYNGDNLVISANGGDGQDGQEGGDGEDGRAGDMADQGQKQQVDEKGFSYSGFGYTEQKYMARGSQGGDGGDAGAGGKGGFGGRKGSVIIHNIGNEEHGIVTFAEQGKQGKTGKDGNPGKGGVKGCDEIIKQRKLSVMGFEINMGSSRSQVNCFTRNKDGRVRKSDQQQKQDNEHTNNDSPVCVHIMRFQDIYLKKFHHSLTDGLTKKFITEMKLTKY